MVETASVSSNFLTFGQWKLIAQKFGAYSGKPLADIGCGDGQWIEQARQKGASIHGMEERALTPASDSEFLTIGSPAAAVPYESHSLDTVLFRGTSLFQAKEFSPELMICLANLGSCLKSKGRLIIPLTGKTPSEIENQLIRWKDQLSVFPGTFRSRLLTPGLMSYLTLSFLLGGNQQVSIIEFQVNRDVVSRLEWHRLARTAVMAKMNSTAVA